MDKLYEIRINSLFNRDSSIRYFKNLDSAQNYLNEVFPFYKTDVKEYIFAIIDSKKRIPFSVEIKEVFEADEISEELPKFCNFKNSRLFEVFPSEEIIHLYSAFKSFQKAFQKNDCHSYRVVQADNKEGLKEYQNDKDCEHNHIDEIQTINGVDYIFGCSF